MGEGTHSVETTPIDRDVGSFRRLLSSPEYEKLRARLVRLFARRGCRTPEDLADETFTRVVGQLPALADRYEGDPLRFFYAVARNVYHEYGRRPVTFPLEDRLEPLTVTDDTETESLHRCLDACMEELDPDERQLIREYYLHNKSAKIEYRKELAARRGLAINALRIRAYRIRQRLYDRMVACLERRKSE